MNDPPLLRSEYLLYSEDIRSFRIELEGLDIDVLKKILRDYSENNVYSIWETVCPRDFVQHIISESDRENICLCIMFILHECGCIYQEEWDWATIALRHDLEKYQRNNHILFDPTLWEDMI